MLTLKMMDNGTDAVLVLTQVFRFAKFLSVRNK